MPGVVPSGLLAAAVGALMAMVVGEGFGFVSPLPLGMAVWLIVAGMSYLGVVISR